MGNKTGREAEPRPKAQEVLDPAVEAWRKREEDAEKVEPLFHAVRAGDEAEVEHFIKQGRSFVNLVGKGASTSVGGERCFSALTWAVHMRNPAIVKQLLAGGAKTEGGDGYPPLLWAMTIGGGCGSEEVIQILLDAGADVEITTYNYSVLNGRCDNLLEFAVRFCGPEIVKMLLDAGADPRPCLKMRGHPDEVAALLRGAEEEFNRSLILQVTPRATQVSQLTELTFHTMGGAIAATLKWPSEGPVKELPLAVLRAIQSSGFQEPFQPLRARNLCLLLPNGIRLDTGADAGSLARQLAAPSPSAAEPAS